jgi:hypothetical protein
LVRFEIKSHLISATIEKASAIILLCNGMVELPISFDRINADFFAGSELNFHTFKHTAP